MSDEADQTSAGRLFQSRGPVVANDRSPTVTHRDGRTSGRMLCPPKSSNKRVEDRLETVKQPGSIVKVTWLVLNYISYTVCTCITVVTQYSSDMLAVKWL